MSSAPKKKPATRSTKASATEAEANRWLLDDSAQASKTNEPSPSVMLACLRDLASTHQELSEERDDFETVEAAIRGLEHSAIPIETVAETAYRVNARLKATMEKVEAVIGALRDATTDEREAAVRAYEAAQAVAT